MSTEICEIDPHEDGGDELRALRFAGAECGNKDRIRLQISVGEPLESKRHVFDRKTWQTFSRKVDAAFNEFNKPVPLSLDYDKPIVIRKWVDSEHLSSEIATRALAIMSRSTRWDGQHAMGNVRRLHPDDAYLYGINPDEPVIFEQS